MKNEAFFHELDCILAEVGGERICDPIPPNSAVHLLIEVGPEKKCKHFILSEAVTTIGRDAKANIVIDDNRVSRSHARVEFNGSAVVYYDLGSSHGTLLNGETVSFSKICHGDILQLGNSKIVVHVVPS